MTTLTTEAFAAHLFDLFERSAYRLEQLDGYVADNETGRLMAFEAKQHVEPEWDRPWAQKVRAVTGAFGSGKSAAMSRVHVFTDPPSGYLRFQISAIYPANVAAGEDVRLLPRSQASELDLPEHDYWLFDDRLVALMTYDAEGNWLAVDLTDDPEVAAQHCRWRDVAMAHATPLRDFTGTPERKTA